MNLRQARQIFSADSDDSFGHLYSDSGESFSTEWKFVSYDKNNKKKCEYCKQWGVRFSVCEHCGARID